MLDRAIGWLFAARLQRNAETEAEDAMTCILAPRAEYKGRFPDPETADEMVKIRANGLLRVALMPSENGGPEWHQVISGRGLTPGQCFDFARNFRRIRTEAKIVEMLRSDDHSVRGDGVGLQFGCMLLYHVNRLRYLRTTFETPQLNVERALSVAESSAVALMDVAFELETVEAMGGDWKDLATSGRKWPPTDD